MALFRRKTETTSREMAEAAEREAKWKELEALVNSGEKQVVVDQTSQVDTGPKLTEETLIGDTSKTSIPRYDLKASIPADIPHVDVTPEIDGPEIDLSATAAPIIAAAAKAEAPQFELEPSKPTEPYKTVEATQAERDMAPKAPARPEPAMRPEPRAESITDVPYTFAPPATPRGDRADLSTMRLDVARITADIQSAEELYRRAQRRIEGLTQVVEKAEVDFSLLNRLEPENRRLKARNRALESEIDHHGRQVEVMRADLEETKSRLSERSRALESATAKLAVATQNLHEYERVLKTTREESDRNALQAERLQTAVDVERRENEVLRDRLSETLEESENKQNAYIEARKIADSVMQDCADYRHQADTAGKEIVDLRNALNEAQTLNNAMKNEMLSLHEDIRTYKTQSEFNIISREDELTSLSAQVDQFRKQLQIKDDIVRNAARDVTELRKVRTSQDLERERLEAHVETQNAQIEELQSRLLQTQQDVTDFDRRYRDVAAAMSVATERRPELVQPIARDIDEAERLSDSEVADRVLDYRLGLRSDIG